MSLLGPLHHVGIVVDDLETASRCLAGQLTLALDRELILPNGNRAAFLGQNGAQLELIEVADPVTRNLRLGDARSRLDHLAFEVPDLDSALAALRRHGVTTVTPGPISPAGRRTIFTHPASTYGLTLQLLEAL